MISDFGIFYISDAKHCVFTAMFYFLLLISYLVFKIKGGQIILRFTVIPFPHSGILLLLENNTNYGVINLSSHAVVETQCIASLQPFQGLGLSIVIRN